MKMYSLNWVMTMLKALLKKQLLEFVSGFLQKGGSKKNQGSTSKGVILVLFIFIFASFMFMFFSMSYMMSELITVGYEWIYFAILGILASLMGIFGSVFMTYNTLYEAKDNDMLLSMPIPSGMVLFTRMAGLYITTFFFEALVLIPAFISWFITAPSVFPGIIFSIINLFVLPLLAVSISCVLGWVIAFFASKIRNKSIITVIFSLVFFAVYYLCGMRINTIINMIMMNAEGVGEWIKKYLYPIYKMGLGCSGDALSYLFFLAVVLLLFALIYKIISHNFIKLATAKKGMKKLRYKEKSVKKASAKTAFFKKELLYFKSTPGYMLNCALGSVMMIILAVFASFRKNDILGVFSMSEQLSAFSLPVVISIALCFVSSTNNLTSVSVSLEGKNLWLLKSVPVSVRDIFFGKIMLHITVTGIPLFIADIIVAAALKTDVLTFILITVFTESFMVLCAVAGLMINLIFPKTDWQNETAVIKQSISPMLGMFFGMFLTMTVVAFYFLTANILSSDAFMFVVSIILMIATAIIGRWLVASGEKKFFLL